jgi:hypothetical protein
MWTYFRIFKDATSYHVQTLRSNASSLDLVEKDLSSPVYNSVGSLSIWFAPPSSGLDYSKISRDYLNSLFGINPSSGADYSSLVPDVFEGATEAVNGFTSSLVHGLRVTADLFYDSANNRMTTLGILSLIGVGVGIVFWVFALVRGLIGRRLS